MRVRRRRSAPPPGRRSLACAPCAGRLVLEAMIALAALASGLSPRDAFGVGIVLVLVGCFLLANSVLFRHPRDLVAEHFGARKAKLVSMRGYIFHRLQVHLGFLYVLIGFGLQLYGHYRAPLVEETARPFPVLWIGAVLLSVVALELGGWWLSHALFLRHVQEHFRAHPPDLEGDLSLARELGELFGIPTAGDDSVQSYLTRIRHRIGAAGPERGAARARAAAAGTPVTASFGEREAEEGLV